MMLLEPITQNEAWGSSMDCASTEGAQAYLSSARHRLAEAIALLAAAGIGPRDPCFTLINAADVAIEDIQHEMAPASSNGRQ